MKRTLRIGRLRVYEHKGTTQGWQRWAGVRRYTGNSVWAVEWALGEQGLVALGAMGWYAGCGSSQRFQRAAGECIGRRKERATRQKRETEHDNRAATGAGWGLGVAVGNHGD